MTTVTTIKKAAKERTEKHPPISVSTQNRTVPDTNADPGTVPEGSGNVSVEGARGQNPTPSDTFAAPGREPNAQNGAREGDQEKKEQERTRIKKLLFLGIYKKTLGSIKATCQKADISRDTFYDWFAQDQEFHKEVRSAWTEKLEDVEEELNKLILSGDGASVRYWLDRRHPLYMPRVKVDGPKQGEMSMEEDIDRFFAEGEVRSYESEDNTEKETSKPTLPRT